MRRFLLGLAVALLPGLAHAACPANPTDCPGPTYKSVTVGGTPGTISVTGPSTLSGGGTLGAFSGGSLTGTDTSVAVTTPTGASTSRTLARRFADCDSDGTNCTVFQAKDWGFAQGATAAVNLSNLQTLATAVCAFVGTSSAGAVIQLPAGRFNVADGTVTFNCNGVTIRGHGTQATVILANNTNTSLFSFLPPANQAYAAGIKISGMRIFLSSNPTAGAFIKFNHVQHSSISDVELDGGFYNVWCISCLENKFSMNWMSGNNSTAGSAGFYFTTTRPVLTTNAGTASGTILHFASGDVTNVVFVGQTVTGTNIPASTTVSSISGGDVTLSQAVSGAIANGASITFKDINNSGNLITDLELHGGSANYTNGIVVTNTDGMTITGGHVGFTSGPALLMKAQFTDDQLGGMVCTGTIFDTSSIGVQISGSGGADTGTRGHHVFTGCASEGMSSKGYLIDDAQMDAMNVINAKVQQAGGTGIEITAGKNYTISGGNFWGNNKLNLSGNDIHIGGTAINVAISGALTFFGSGATPVATSILIDGSADYISTNFGAMTFKGITTRVYDATGTSGTHIATSGQGITDINAGWLRTAASPADIPTSSLWKTGENTPLFGAATSSSGGVGDYPEFQSNGLGSGGTHFCKNTSTSNTKCIFQGQGTGITQLGASTNSSANVIPPMVVGAQASSALTGATSQIANAKFSAANDQVVRATYQLYVTTSGAAAVRPTIDGAAASTTNCGNLTANNTKATLRSITLTATDITTPANDYAYFVPVGFLRRYTGVGSTTYTNGTPIENGTGTGTGAGAPTTAITADTTNACPDIEWTPPTGNTDTWHVVVSFNMDTVQ